MYCIKCGVRLADTEKKCPLCGTTVYHPEIAREAAEPLYPEKRMPTTASGRKVFCGAIIILFMFPLVLTFLSDIWPDGKIDWFGFVAGGILLAYLTFAFPVWFEKPNPVILVPCDFAAYIAYLLYVCLATGGSWFFSVALPVSLGAAAITCTLVTLLYYLKGRGRLYIIGGSIIAIGALMLMIEWLIVKEFSIPFVGWSLYPLITLALFGGLLIYLAMNRVAREKIERKLFF